MPPFRRGLWSSLRVDVCSGWVMRIGPLSGRKSGRARPMAKPFGRVGLSCGPGIGSRLSRGFPGPLFGSVLCTFPWTVLGTLLLGYAIARIVRPVRYQIGREHAGHVAAGRVMLTQKARERSGRNRLQKSSRTLVAGSAGSREYLRGTLAGFEILRLRQRSLRCDTASQKHRRRQAKRSAQHSKPPEADIRSGVTRATFAAIVLRLVMGNVQKSH